MAEYCIGCNSGHYVSGGNCLSCSSNCSKCTSTSNCLTCSSGYYLNGAACSTISTAIDNCDTYQAATTCATCQSGYYLSNGKCTSCSILCSSCTGIHFGTCSACNSNSVLYNQMCIPNRYSSTSAFQLYYSFPSAASIATQGTQNCNRYLYSGTTLSIALNSLGASKVTVKWRLFSVGASTSYSVGWTNSAGTSSYSFSTSTSQG